MQNCDKCITLQCRCCCKKQLFCFKPCDGCLAVGAKELKATLVIKYCTMLSLRAVNSPVSLFSPLVRFMNVLSQANKTKKTITFPKFMNTDRSFKEFFLPRIGGCWYQTHDVLALRQLSSPCHYHNPMKLKEVLGGSRAQGLVSIFVSGPSCTGFNSQHPPKKLIGNQCCWG